MITKKSLLPWVTAVLFTMGLGPAEASGLDECESGLWCAKRGEIHVRMRGVDFVTVPGAPDPREYRYTLECLGTIGPPVARMCDSDTVLRDPTPDCEQGSAIPPRWSRPRGADDDAWFLEALSSCPGDTSYPITFDDFAVLPIDPSPARIQPEQSWVYAGLDTIALTSDEPQGFVVELRGQVYYVGAIPLDFTWDFDDGSPPLTTTDPGQPWPDHTVAHTYTTAGSATPTLTTRWKGAFQIAGMGEWFEIPGTAETSSSVGELRIYAPRPRLVDDPLA